MVELSGWSVEYKEDLVAASLRDVLPLALTPEEQQEIDGTEGLVTALYTEIHSLGDDGKLRVLDQFRSAVSNHKDIPQYQRTVYVNDAIDLFFKIYNLRGTDVLWLFNTESAIDAVNQYRHLKQNFGKYNLYANAAFRSQRDVYLCAALKLHEGRHPEIPGCKAIEVSHAHAAFTIFINILQCERRDTHISVPQPVLDVCNQEKRGEALLSSESQDLRVQLEHISSLLNVSAAGIWKHVQSIAKKFGFKLQKRFHDRGGIRNQFESVTLIQDLPAISHWSLYDARVFPGRFVRVADWEAHETQLDMQRAEEILETELAITPASASVSPGMYEEFVHKDTLMELINRDKPNFPNTDAGAKQSKKWDTDQRRLHSMADACTELDEDVMVLRLSAYKKYMVGRRIMPSPSLQGMPKAYRGPLTYRYCHDLDIENCHYSIMSQIAAQHNVNLDCVKVLHDRDSVHIADARRCDAHIVPCHFCLNVIRDVGGCETINL